MACLGSFKPSKSDWPWHWPVKVTKIKCNHTNGLPMDAFLLIFNSHIWPTSAPLWDIGLRTMSDLDFDLSRSLKVICNSVIWLPIYAFLLMLNSNIWPNCTPLWDTRLQNVSDPDFDLSRSLKVKCDSVIRLPIYAFILMFNSNIWPNSAPFQDKSLRNLSDLVFDFQGHSRSNVMVSLDVPYTVCVDTYSNHMSISHRLALIATQNVFFDCVSGIRPKSRKSNVHLMTPNDLEWCRAKDIPYNNYVELLPVSPKFHPVSLYDRSFSR